MDGARRGDATSVPLKYRKAFICLQTISGAILYTQASRVYRCHTGLQIKLSFWGILHKTAGLEGVFVTPGRYLHSPGST